MVLVVVLTEVSQGSATLLNWRIKRKIVRWIPTSLFIQSPASWTNKRSSSKKHRIWFRLGRFHDTSSYQPIDISRERSFLAHALSRLGSIRHSTQQKTWVFHSFLLPLNAKVRPRNLRDRQLSGSHIFVWFTLNCLLHLQVVEPRTPLECSSLLKKRKISLRWHEVKVSMNGSRKV